MNFLAKEYNKLTGNNNVLQKQTKRPMSNVRAIDVSGGKTKYVRLNAMPGGFEVPTMRKEDINKYWNQKVYTPQIRKNIAKNKKFKFF